MSTNTNAVLQRTTSASGSKRKADNEGLGTAKKKTTKKKASGLIISRGPGPLPRSSSALGHSSPSTSRPATALAQHPHDQPSRRPTIRQPPQPSPPVPTITDARAQGDSTQPVDPTPTRAPNRTSSVARTIPQPQSLLKGKGKARAPGLGLPDSRQPRGVLEEDAQLLEGERWMAGQRSELDARERDNQRRAERKPNKPRPPANQSSSSVLSRVALDSIEPVPISDTPVIVRNREIRQVSQSRRRSSLSSRASPHPSVPPDTFFRHVDPDLPDDLVGLGPRLESTPPLVFIRILPASHLLHLCLLYYILFPLEHG
ncbi:hypothetical protein FRC12_000283 [Ceratobasidium sp. 428]|nr:hypothetical protein FRC12_000283 [Ceratobasidium sp. 428]